MNGEYQRSVAQELTIAPGQLPQIMQAGVPISSGTVTLKGETTPRRYAFLWVPHLRHFLLVCRTPDGQARPLLCSAEIVMEHIIQKVSEAMGEGFEL